MRTQVIRLGLAIVLLCPLASARWVQTNGLIDRQVPHHPLMDTNVLQETPRGLLGLANQTRRQADVVRWLDSLRAKGMHSPLPDENFISNGNHKALRSLQRISSSQSKMYVIDTAIVKSNLYSNDTTRHLYSFNANAKRTSELMQRLMGGLWVDTLRHTNTYDASNNVLSDLYEYWSNGQWIQDRPHETYTYDANGNMLTHWYEYWSNGQLHFSDRYAYTYDANGNRLTMLHWRLSNGEWVNTFRDTYTYDANGNMLSHLEESWLNEQWMSLHRWTYTYDANGHMLSYLEKGWQNGQTWWFQNTYTYDANGNRLSELEMDSTWLGVTSLRTTYTYDTNRKMLSCFVEKGTKLGQWEGYDRSTYTYDENGNILSSMHEIWRNGQREINTWTRFSYTYDANGLLLSESSEYWYNGQWMNGSRSTYTYDASHNMLSDLSEYGSNVQWVNGHLKTYTFDAQSNLTSFWNYGWLDSTWIPRDIAGIYASRLTYSYDARSNLTSIDNYSGLDSSWIPRAIGGKVPGPSGFSLYDSAGNEYYFPVGFSFTFARKLIVTAVLSAGEMVPLAYSLSQNYPNPFNPSTTIRFELPKSAEVSLSVYDLLGREVSVLMNERRDAGAHEAKFDGSNLASGVYFYRLQAGGFVDVKKFVLLK